MRKHRGARLLGVLLWLGAACGDDPATSPLAGKAPGEGGFLPAAEGDPRLLEVIASEYDLNPRTLIVEPGERLLVSLRNQDPSAAHGLEFEMLEERFSLGEPVEPGASARMEFIAPVQPGVYDFSCTAADAATEPMRGRLLVMGAPVVRLEQIAQGLVAPNAITVAPRTSDGRRFVVDQIGVVYLMAADDSLGPVPFLDLRARMIALDPEGDERGLLGLAFHPGFRQNGRLFVAYSAPLRAGAPPGWDHTSVVSELRVTPGELGVELQSERVLLALDREHRDPAFTTLAFGPGDGLLYVAARATTPTDDGIEGPPDGALWSGAVLRLDVDAAPDERGDTTGAQPELFATGFGDPTGLAFDSSDVHTLLAPDTGVFWQEVNVVQPNGNYGFGLREGTHCSAPADAQSDATVCAGGDAAGEPLRWPVVEFASSVQDGGIGAEVVGGGVYRGPAVPALFGRYVFATRQHGDDPRALLLCASDPDPSAEDLWPLRRVAIEGGDYYVESYLRAIGQDARGELYLLVSDDRSLRGTSGRVLRLEAPGP